MEVTWTAMRLYFVLSFVLAGQMPLHAVQGARIRVSKARAEKIVVEEQQHSVEEAWQEQNTSILQEIAALRGDEFQGLGDASMSVSGAGHKLLWDFFPPIYPCPLVWQVGRLPEIGDGAKYICGAPLLRQESCVVYSFGSNGQVSFEEDMIRRTGCEVHVFDPTMDELSIQKVEAVAGITFHRYGLGGFDGEVLVEGGARAYNDRGAGRPTMTIKRLDTIMSELGHVWIDVLKVDVEGAEYPFLEAYTTTGADIPATQMQVEFHHYFNQISAQRLFQIMLNLTSAGNMRPFHSEPNLWFGNNGRDFVEYAFLHMDKSGDLMGKWVLETPGVSDLEHSSVLQ